MDWKSEEFFDSADDYYASLFKAMELAKTSIDFEVYIFEKSLIGDRVIAALKKAAERGVAVRLLVDGFGSLGFISAYQNDLSSSFQVKIYHPVPWQKWSSKYSAKSQGWWPTNFFQLLASMNSRNHRKVCLIDNAVAFLGSYNVSDVHLAEVRRALAWRDYGTRVAGDCVQLLTFGFLKAWKSTLKNINISNMHTPTTLRRFFRFFILNHSLSTRLRSRHRLFRRLQSAQSRIWLVTPYFVPTRRLIRFLKAAAKRGVDVRLLLPQTNDVVFMHWVMKCYYGVLNKSGVKIYEYLPSVLHAKAAIVDDWCAVGSMNLNSRSVLHDLEANYILQSSEVKKKLEQAVERDFKLSELIGKTTDYPWYEFWLGRTLLVFKYWI